MLIMEIILFLCFCNAKCDFPLFCSQQYQSEAKMMSTGKKTFIPCLEDKYDDGGSATSGATTIIPMSDNMSLVSSIENQHDPAAKLNAYCFLTNDSMATLSDLMLQLSQV